MEINDQLKAQADAVEARAKERFGKSYQDRLSALAAAGVHGEVLAQVVSRPDAVDVLDFASKEAMCRAAGSVVYGADGNSTRPYDPAAERAYDALRAEERAAHRRLRGRA